jgi:hypothetical protein
MQRALPICVALALLAGCGSDGDEPDQHSETTPRPSGTALFRSARIPFTFEYPDRFAAERRPNEPVLARVGVRRGARLNAIKVRRTARRELGLARYLDEFRRDFERSVGAVEQREERIGALEVGVLEFTDTVERARGPVEFTSTSYFFAGAGRTWQIECIADEDHRAELDSACRGALESLAF